MLTTKNIDQKSTQTIIQSAIDLLIDPQKALADVLSPELIQSICYKKNVTLMRAFKIRLEEELEKIPSLNEPQELLKGKIDNLLSFMAYTELQDGLSIKIPTIINKQFELINYEVERLTLTSEHLGTAYKCYGLIPPNAISTHARLLFMGTTFPTADGFSQALLADTAPGGGVGYLLYLQGKGILQQWINTQYRLTNLPVHCSGQSLGGAMAMHAYIHQPSKVSFTAINPPFLTNAEKKVFDLSQNEQLVTKNQIYSHILDPIARIGHWFPQTADVYLHGTKGDFSGSWLHKLFKAHAAQLTSVDFKSFKGSDYLRILRIDPDRMASHYALKPVRAFAFTTLFAASSLNSIYENISSYAEYYLNTDNSNSKEEIQASEPTQSLSK